MQEPVPLVDSCGTVGDKVADLIRTDSAYLTGPIIVELLHGVRGKKEKDWIDTGEVLQKLRLHGVTLPLTDVLTSCVAIRHDMAVLTLDKHFTHLAVDCLGMV